MCLALSPEERAVADPVERRRVVTRRITTGARSRDHPKRIANLGCLLGTCFRRFRQHPQEQLVERRWNTGAMSARGDRSRRNVLGDNCGR